MTTLTQKVLEYRKDGKGSKILMEGIVKEILERSDDYGLHNKDEAAEIICDFYPRLPGLIERFREGKVGFEAYLSTSLRFFRKSSYLRNKFDRDRFESCRDRIGADLLESIEAPPEVDEPPHPTEDAVLLENCVNANRGPSLESAGKRLLFLCLKCSLSLSNEQLDQFGRRLGLGEGHLRLRAECLRSLARDRLERVRFFSAARDGVFGRLLLAEGKLKREVDPEKSAALMERVAALRERVDQCRRRVKRIRLAPSNGEIALVLGIPKGTVDSGLHYLKRFHSSSLHHAVGMENACPDIHPRVSSAHAHPLRKRKRTQGGRDEGALPRP